MQCGCLLEYISFTPDINECENNNGGCDQRCVNSFGGFRCDCFEGYIHNKSTNQCNGENKKLSTLYLKHFISYQLTNLWHILSCIQQWSLNTL